MSTLTQVVTAISSRLQDDSNSAVSTSQVVGAINESIEHWKKKRFWFNEFQSTSQTMTIGTATIPQPSSTEVTILYPFERGGIVIDYSSSRYELKRIDSATYDSMNTQGNGLPFVYTYRNNAYEAYWYPDQAYSVIWRGIKDYDDFSSTSSTESNNWTVEAESLIKYDALSRLQAELRLDPEMTTYYENRTVKEFQNLQFLTRRLQGSGQLETDSFLGG